MSNHGDPPVNTVSTEALRQAVKQLPSKQKVLTDQCNFFCVRRKGNNADDRTSLCMKTLYMPIPTIPSMRSMISSTILKLLDIQNIEIYFRSGFLKVHVKVNVWYADNRTYMNWYDTEQDGIRYHLEKRKAMYSIFWMISNKVLPKWDCMSESRYCTLHKVCSSWLANGTIPCCWLIHAIGNFGDVESFDYAGNDVEQHMEKIKENNSLLQQSGALSVVYSALRKACEEHNSRKYVHSNACDLILNVVLIFVWVAWATCKTSTMKLRFFCQFCLCWLRHCDMM
jgi:hypothetical protein